MNNKNNSKEQKLRELEQLLKAFKFILKDAKNTSTHLLGKLNEHARINKQI